MLALVERNAVLAAPITSSATSAGATEGASATPVIVALKTSASSVSDRRPTFMRRATTSPPITAPTPIAEVMKPYALAPPCSGPVASSGSTTWNS